MSCTKASRKRIIDFVSCFDAKGTYPIALMMNVVPKNLPLDLPIQKFKGLVPNGDNGYLSKGALCPYGGRC